LTLINVGNEEQPRIFNPSAYADGTDFIAADGTDLIAADGTDFTARIVIVRCSSSSASTRNANAVAHADAEGLPVTYAHSENGAHAWNANARGFAHTKSVP
jgi:hypothetical protein